MWGGGQTLMEAAYQMGKWGVEVLLCMCDSMGSVWNNLKCILICSINMAVSLENWTLVRTLIKMHPTG
jgi:hypothetical protein